MTRVDDNMDFALGYEKKVEVKPATALETLGKGFKVVCRNCGENHLTYKCPYAPGVQKAGAAPEDEQGMQKALEGAGKGLLWNLT
jgi:hypothetical protein